MHYPGSKTKRAAFRIFGEAVCQNVGLSMLFGNPTAIPNGVRFESEPTLRSDVKLLLLGQIILKDNSCRDQLVGVLDS